MKTTALMTICTLAVAVAAYGQGEGSGEGGGRKGKQDGEGRERAERPERPERGGDEAVKAFRQQQMEARREHHKAQREANRAHRESCKDLEPQATCLSIIEHRNTQYAENMAFMDGQHEAAVAFARSHGAEKQIPEEQIDERVAKMTEKHDEMKARMTEGHNSLIAALTELSTKEGLTTEDIMNTMKAHAPERGRGRHREGGGDDQGKRERKGKHQRKGGEGGGQGEESTEV